MKPHYVPLMVIMLLCSSAVEAGGLSNGDFSDESLSGWNVSKGQYSGLAISSVNKKESQDDKVTDYVNISNHKVTLPEGDSILLYQQIEVTPGYYDVVAVLSSTYSDGNCYVFGKGRGYTMGSTAVPQVLTSDKLDTVYVRGVGTVDGKLTIGVYNDGRHNLSVKSLSVQSSSAYYYLQGGDITMLNYVLDMGGIYRDENGNALTSDNLSREENAERVIKYLADNGLNFVRIRLSNNPGVASPDNSGTYCLPDGYQDESDCLQLAKMAHDAGMKIQFTFNWSDYWSNGTCQNIPSDWKTSISGLTDNNAIISKLTDCCYTYTYKVMSNLAALGIYPEYVSLGNETNGGFLFPYGYAYDVTSDNATADMPVGSANWSAIASFVNAGYKAVKEVSANSQVVIHLADNTYDIIDKSEKPDWFVYAWYFDALKNAGGQFDVIGASYYPSWSAATAKQAAKYYNVLMNRYDKDILVMETGYNWTEKRKDGYDGQLPYNAPDYSSLYPFSQSGQKGFVCDVINAQKSVGSGSEHHVLGDLYWDPMMMHVEDANGVNQTGWAHFVSTGKADVNVVENTSFFDFDGKSLPVFDAYRYNNNSLPLDLHKITVIEADGGSVKTSAAQLYMGDTLQFTCTPAEGYQLSAMRVISDDDTLTYTDALPDYLMLMPDADVSLVAEWVKEPTSVSDVMSGDFSVYSVGNMLEVLSNHDISVSVYTETGALEAVMDVKAGIRSSVALKSGIYVVAGKKILIK